ncbi:MAG: DUF2330 domain-containing protein [bacterium]
MRSVFFSIAAAAFIGGSALLGSTNDAVACAGLIGSNGSVNLGRTTTLAAYHNGEEHYVTSFEFQGTGGGEFGTLIPLPGIPSNVERGGDWTLQRLVRETSPVEKLAFAAALSDRAGASGAEVLIEKRIDALDLTVLRGGGPDVAKWAQEHGFHLSPDAPEVLDFYAERSPIFLAAVFDGDAAIDRGQGAGDGTPVHLTIPTDNPWVPLRILGLGKQETDRVQADVYLLTDQQPRILPGLRSGLTRDYSADASDSLLDDLRSDKGMSWVPKSAWLTKIGINSKVSDLKYDLAVDADGAQRPSSIAAGLEKPQPVWPQTVVQATNSREGSTDNWGLLWVLLIPGGLAVALLLAVRAQSGRSSK